MAKRKVKIWFDREADFRETENDQVMEKADAHGNVPGFSVLEVSALTESPF